MRKIKDYAILVFDILMLIALVCLVLFAIGFTIYVWVTYGNLPPDQVPSWAHWWMMGR